MVRVIICILAIFFYSPVVLGETEFRIEGADVYNNTAQQMSDGTFSLAPIDIIHKAYDIILSEIIECKVLLVTVIIIGALSAVTKLIETSFAKRGVGECAFYMCLCAICTVCIEYFGIALEYLKEVVFVINTFITKLSPILSTFLILSGKISSASAFHPILSTGVYVMSLVIEHCLIPLITYGAVLSLVNYMSGTVTISGVVRLINSITKWILAAAFTLFSGICGIYGFSAPALDAMSAKTMKFAVGTLVPVVGNFLSETLDTVLGGSAMMKNVVGSAGIVAICIMCALPVVKLGIIVLMMKASAAVIEPIADKRLSKLMWDISSQITLLFAVVITVAILFIVCISIIIGATS